jgi:hypothetical protein
VSPHRVYETYRTRRMEKSELQPKKKKSEVNFLPSPMEESVDSRSVQQQVNPHNLIETVSKMKTLPRDSPPSRIPPGSRIQGWCQRRRRRRRSQYGARWQISADGDNNYLKLRLDFRVEGGRCR